MPKVKNSPRDVEDPQCCICLENTALINQPCGIRTHRICKTCITRIIESMPISVNSPSICCQYPYSTCEFAYSKPFIRNILKEKYPIYKLATDSYTYNDYSTGYCPSCESLLVFEDDIDYSEIYDCVYCLKSFCFGCKKESSIEITNCNICSGFNIINPYTFNYFFYKKDRNSLTDYFYLNIEVDPEEACKQLLEKIEDLSVRCPVCITPVQRSEQCNALKHCHVEICLRKVYRNRKRTRRSLECSRSWMC
jgi:hypothetical protein